MSQCKIKREGEEKREKKRNERTEDCLIPAAGTDAAVWMYICPFFFPACCRWLEKVCARIDARQTDVLKENEQVHWHISQ